MNIKIGTVTRGLLITSGLAFSTLPAWSADGTWASGTTGGDWSTPANWTGGTPAGGAGATATFTGTSGGEKVVSLDEDVTLGALSFDGSGWNGLLGWKLVSSQGKTLTLSSGTSSAPTINGGHVNIAATLAGSQGLTISAGNSNILLSGNNTYTGETRLTNGKLFVSSNNAFGASGAGNGTTVSQASGQYPQLHISNNITTAEDITLSVNWYSVGTGGSVVGGTLLFNDNGNNTINGNLTINREAGNNAQYVHSAKVLSSEGTLAINGNVSGSATGGQASGNFADQTRLVLGSGNNASIEVNGNISDGTLSGGGLSIYTEDSGTVLLSGNNTYTGSTVHQGGTLLVNNAAGSGTGFGTVRVKSGATFSGNGIVAPTGANDVVFESGSIVNPGNIAAGEKLTFDLGDTTGKVIFESGAIVLIDVSADAGMVDYLNFVGVISGSGDVIFNNNVINFAVSGGILADGIYTLASFSADNAYTGRLVLGSGLEGHNATLLFNANSIQLQIGTIPEPSTFGLLSGIAILVTVFVVRRRR